MKVTSDWTIHDNNLDLQAYVTNGRQQWCCAQFFAPEELNQFTNDAWKQYVQETMPEILATVKADGEAARDDQEDMDAECYLGDEQGTDAVLPIGNPMDSEED